MNFENWFYMHENGAQYVDEMYRSAFISIRRELIKAYYWYYEDAYDEYGCNISYSIHEIIDDVRKAEKHIYDADNQVSLY